jgi:hypothetical protein
LKQTNKKLRERAKITKSANDQLLSTIVKLNKQIEENNKSRQSNRSGSRNGLFSTLRGIVRIFQKTPSKE